MRRQISSSIKRQATRRNVNPVPGSTSSGGDNEDNSISTLLSSLKHCATNGDLSGGKKLHKRAADAGFHNNVYIANALISMYSKCRKLALAHEVFDQAANIRNVVLWNTLILGYVANGRSLEALHLFESVDCEPTSFTIVAGLKALSHVAEEKTLDKLSCLLKGQDVHERSKRLGVDRIIFVTNALVEMYSRCGCMQMARDVFETMSKRDVILWTTLIHGYVEDENYLEALTLFTSMDCQPDHFTYVTVLKACSGAFKLNLRHRVWCLDKGQEIHQRAQTQGLERDTFVSTGLIELYSKCGCMSLARDVFNGMAKRNVVAWNTLLLGHAENGEGSLALESYRRMDCEPDTFTFVAVLKACACLGEEDRELCWETGMCIHERAKQLGVDNNLYVASNLVEVFSKAGHMLQARQVFENMNERDVVAWTSLILGYLENGENEVALEVFDRMDCEPSSFTYVAALKACSRLAAEGNMARKKSCLKKGVEIHKQARDRGLDTDAFVACNLVSMFSKCGEMHKARAVFDGMITKGVVLWNALLVGYVEAGDSSLVLELFKCMDCEPTHVTYVAVLKACASLGSLSFGKEIHAKVVKLGLADMQIVANTLVYFYGKCSRFSAAEELFQSMAVTTDVACWNVLIAGYSSMGLTSKVFHLVKTMQENGVGPDGITFVLILMACSHSGLVEEGKKWLGSMASHGIEPTLEHYTCVLDMLGRANMLQEALSLINDMPCEVDSVAWTALLGSCKNQANYEVGRVAFDALLKHKDSDHRGVAYVLMSDIYMKQK